MAKDEDELQVIEDEQAQGETVVIDDEKAQQAAGSDERTAQVEDEEGDEPRSTDPATEALRAQRRLERKAKKLREHQARDRNRKELDLLRARNEVLERRQSQLEQRTFQTEYSSVDGQLYKIAESLRAADEVIEKGINEQDGASVREAQNIKAELQQAQQRLLYNKQQIAQAAQQAAQQTQQQQQPQQQVAPEVIEHANAWKAKNSWYKPGKADDDSAIVAALDDRLVAEGMDPRDPEYWDELTERVKQRLPHHFGASNGNGQQERRGPAMANGGRERQLRSGEMYVSAERKEALIQAGAWDDPKLRNKYLKRYAEYDEAARRNT